jgi:hypothetical protein
MFAAKQLAIAVRELVTKSANKQPLTNSPQVVLHLAQNDPQEILRPPKILLVNRTCTDRDRIPDFALPPRAGSELRFGSTSPSDRDYYRALVDYYCRVGQYKPFRLAVENTSNVGVRDLYLEIHLAGLDGEVLSEEPENHRPRRPFSEPAYPGGSVVIGSRDIFYSSPVMPYGIPTIKLNQEQDQDWLIKFELPVVQAQRTIYSGEFYLDAKSSSTLEFNTIVYSSTSVPQSIEFTVDVEVQQDRKSYVEILRELEVDLPS